DGAPFLAARRTRTYTCLTPGSDAVVMTGFHSACAPARCHVRLVNARFDASEVKATRRQPPSTCTSYVAPLACRSRVSTDTRVVAPELRSVTNASGWLLVSPDTRLDAA